jgi:uncharacterized protein with FMN-binding domain
MNTSAKSEQAGLRPNRDEKREKGMYREWMFRLVVLAVLLLMLPGGQLCAEEQTAQSGSIVTSMGPIEKIADGVYRGAFQIDNFKIEVDVTVKENRIAGLELVDSPDAELVKETEETFRRVIDAQSTMVDAVSGATGSSYMLLDAIENAFGDIILE